MDIGKFPICHFALAVCNASFWFLDCSTMVPSRNGLWVASANSGPLQALVVKDVVPQLRLLVRTLDKAGLNVLGVSSAGQAIEVLAATPGITLLVTGVRLGGKDEGFALAQVAQRYQAHIKAILITAYSRDILTIETSGPHAPKVTLSPYSLSGLASTAQRLAAEVQS